MNAEQLQRMMLSPAAFREELLIDTGKKDPVPLAVAMAANPWQRADFESLDGGGCKPRGFLSRKECRFINARGSLVREAIRKARILRRRSAGRSSLLLGDVPG